VKILRSIRASGKAYCPNPDYFIEPGKDIDAAEKVHRVKCQSSCKS